MTLSLGTGLALGRTSRPPGRPTDGSADAGGAPELLVAPGLTGDGRIGGLLAVDPGLWRGADRFDFLWLRDAAPIAGATSATYAPTPQDDRARIACRITAWAGARSRVAQTPEIPIAVAPPRPAGALPDLEYTQHTGFHIVDASSLFSGASLSFSVSGPGVSVDPATGVLTIGSEALLSGAGIVVTARNSGGEAEIGFTLKVTPAEAPGPVAPALLAAPRLDGAGLVGVSLVVDPGLWSGDPAPDMSLQWLREGAPIAGAVSDSFMPGAAEDACAVSCLVTAENVAGAASAETPTILVVRPAPQAVGALSDVVLALGGAGVEIPAAGVFAGAGLRFAAAGAGASIDPETGVVALTATATRAGEIVTVTASNSGGAAQASFAATVLAAPEALGAPDDLAFAVGSGAQAAGVAAFFAGAELVFALKAAPAGVTIDAATGVVTIPTGTALSGAIVARASNAVGAAEIAFSVTVLAAPEALGAPGDLVFAVGSESQAAGVGTFFAGADLIFALEAAPAGVTIDAATGVVTIPTGTALSGAVVARASNAVGVAEIAFSVTVLAAPEVKAPTTVGAPVDVVFALGTGPQTVSAQAFFAGADLVFSLDEAPEGVTINPGSGLVTTPTNTAVSGRVTVRAANAGGAALASFQLTVRALATVFDASAGLADVTFLHLVAPPSWGYDASVPAAVLSPGRVSDAAHGDWKLGGGDGRYRALVNINHSALNIDAYSRARPFGLNGRMSFMDGNWRGVRIELDRQVSNGAVVTAFEIREYVGTGTNQTLLGRFPVGWSYDVWCWIEAEFEGGTVRARTYPEGATAPDWQAVAQISTPDGGFFGPMSHTFAAKIWPIVRLRRLEFQPIGGMPVAALDAQWTLEQIEAQQ